MFAPWENGGYVVIDIPEAIFSDLGLTNLALQLIPTLWEKQSISLPRLVWKEDGDGLPGNLYCTMIVAVAIVLVVQMTID